MCSWLEETTLIGAVSFYHFARIKRVDMQTNRSRTNGPNALWLARIVKVLKARL